MTFLCIKEQGVKEETAPRQGWGEGKRKTELVRAREGSHFQALAGAIRKKSNWNANRGVSEPWQGRNGVTLVAIGWVEDGWVAGRAFLVAPQTEDGGNWRPRLISRAQGAEGAHRGLPGELAR